MDRLLDILSFSDFPFLLSCIQEAWWGTVSYRCLLSRGVCQHWHLPLVMEGMCLCSPVVSIGCSPGESAGAARPLAQCHDLLEGPWSTHPEIFERYNLRPLEANVTLHSV